MSDEEQILRLFPLNVNQLWRFSSRFWAVL